MLQIKRGFLEIAINNLESYEDDYLDKIENYENSSSELSDNYCSDLNEYLSSSLIERSIAFKMVVSDLVEDIKNNSDKLEPCFYARFKPIYDEYGEDFLRETLKMYFNTHWKMPMELGEAMISDDTNRLNAISADLNSKYQRVLTETTIADLKEKLTNQQVIQQSQPIKQEQDLPVISHYISDFLGWDEGGRSRNKNVIQTYSRELNFLIACIGDKPVNKVTKQDLRDSISIKQRMPKMNMSPYRDWSLGDTVEKIKSEHEVEEDDVVSSKTVKETFKCYQSFFSAFLCNRKDIIEKTPTSGIKVPSKSEPYGDYSIKQMELIVNHYKSLQDSDKKMVTLAACYTGMRLSEICNIRKDTLRYDDESGYYYIFIEKGKTEAARRIVPVCKKLRALGFVDYVESLKENQCLYTKKTDLVTDELRKVRDKLGIPHQNNYEQRLVFHSFRHTVITRARAELLEEILVKRFIGHSINKGETDGYDHHAYSVQKLSSVAECLPW